MWEGENCKGVEASCCENYAGYAVLPSSTTDDIEIRVCSDEATTDEDIALDFIQISVY